MRIRPDDLIDIFKHLLEPYGNQDGLDREDSNFCRGIERAAGEIAKHLFFDIVENEKDINDFLDACGVQFKLDALGK